jgi:hypothetical protein
VATTATAAIHAPYDVQPVANCGCERADANCEGDLRLTPAGWLCGWHAATWRPDPERAPAPGALLAAPAVTSCRCSRMLNGSCMNLWPGHPAYGACRCACHANDAPDPQIPAAREAAQRADEAERHAGLLATLPPMAGGTEAPRCPDCGESVAARDCEPCVLATPSPMAGGAPTPADEPAGPGASEDSTQTPRERALLEENARLRNELLALRAWATAEHVHEYTYRGKTVHGGDTSVFRCDCGAAEYVFTGGA